MPMPKNVRQLTLGGESRSGARGGHIGQLDGDYDWSCAGGGREQCMNGGGDKWREWSGNLG